jgi:hypothetical protein
MRPAVHGEPVHTRALGASMALADDGTVHVAGSLLDLRTRGFLPVGGSMQGMGIIHHMELAWVVDPGTLTVRSFEPAQPTVAFEATPETGGESCRQPMDAVRALAGTRLGEGFARTLREAIGGALGCSHILTLAFFLDGAVRAGLARDRAASPERWASMSPGTITRRDLVFDAHEVDDGHVEVVVRFGDLDWNDASPTALAPDRFRRHHELAATVDVDLWPGEIRQVAGAERERTPASFAESEWIDRGGLLEALAGTGLARGAAGEIMRRLGDEPGAAPWRDALLQLAPALVQCRAAHPDAWHDKVRRTPRHPGLTAIPDSCWMWRRGGALERIRERHGAGVGGR